MNNRKEFWKTVYKSYKTVLFLLLIFGLSVFSIVEITYIKNLSKTIDNQLSLEASIFSNEINDQTSHLLYLADIVARIFKYLPEEEIFLDTTRDTLADFANKNPDYDQVRLLSLEGKELIRINRVAGFSEVAPDESLQDKSDRYFFQEAIQLGRGEVYISKFDLNIEYKEIEVPIKPVYRLITPVDTDAGQRIGYLVINVLGQSILDRIAEAEDLFPGSLYMINDQGYWLLGPEDVEVWGFMYPDNQNSNISEKYPNVWAEYDGENSFQKFYIDKLITFWTIDPLGAQTYSGKMTVSGNLREKWLLVSQVGFWDLISGIGFVIFLATICIVLILSNSFKQAEKDHLSEQKAFKAREESEKRLEIISSASQDAIIMINEAGLIEYWSQSSEKLFGYSAAEAFEKDIHDIVIMHQTDRDVAAKGIKDFSKNGRGSVIGNLREVDAKTKGGKIFPVEISISPVKIDDKWWAVGIIRDISDRKKAEKNLAELNKNLEGLVQERTKEIEIINRELSISEKRYRAIIESQVEFVFRWDLNGVITYSNRSFIKRFNSRRKNFIGKCYKDVISSEGMDELYAQMASITANHPLLTTEIRNVLSKGQVVWEQWNSRAILNENNEIIEIQNVGRDITALKQAQEQVYIQSSALEAAANGIVITDTEGIIIWANQAISRLTGFTLRELIGKNPRIFKSGKTDEKIYKDLWGTIISGKVWSGEVINRKKDGSLYTEEMTITPISREDGTIANFIAIKQDITARKEIELEVHQAKEQAEMANRAKSTFLANISHEIRTPLNAIMGLNYLLRRTGVSDVQEKYLDKIQTASRTLLDTINDVLDFSKIEAEKIEIEKVAFDLESVFLDISDTEALKAHQKGIELLVFMGEEIPERIEGDPIRLKQVLRNLTNNAVKFTENGEVVIDAKKIDEDGETVTLQFSVSDTGIGLSPEQIDGLFVPFQQADISTTRKYGGSGLGLAISKRIIELMNGEIWVKSEVGKGSTFYFTVPFNKVKPRKKVDLFASKEIIGKKVLIIDSNIKSYQWLARILKPTQAEITHIADILTLDEILNADKEPFPFDVILVNNNVKGFRRLEDLIGIKEKLKLKDVKVIHLTDTVQFAQRVQDSGTQSIDAVLIKPVNASQLYNTWLSLFSSEKAGIVRAKLDQTDAGIDKYFDGLDILLVEDNEINQEVIKELLKQKGAEIVVAENGQIALDDLEKSKFDLILMDIQMPVMDGFTSAKEIRKKKKYASLPIIALTANAQLEEKNKAIQVGMNDYITKPIEPKLLFNAVARWAKKEAITGEEDLHAKNSENTLDIPGLDAAKGLIRLNNDFNLYVTLLKKFLNNHKEDIKKIGERVNDGDWDEALSIVHAMKGAAANLGAGALVDSLVKIQSLINEHDVRGIQTELAKAAGFLNAIEKRVTSQDLESKTDRSGQPFLKSRKEILKKLKLLQTNVRDSNPEAKTIFKEINQFDFPAQYNELLTSVQVSLNAYDFNKALLDIEKIINRVKGENKNG